MRKLHRIAVAENTQPGLMTHQNQIDRATRAASTERLFAVVSNCQESVRSVFAAMAIFDQFYSQANDPENCGTDIQMTAFLALKRVIPNGNQLESGLKGLFNSEKIA